MLACDAMVTNVITVTPEADVADIAALLVQHRISAVPVMEGDRLVGIVTESDLLRRTETGTEARRSRWAEYFTSRDELAREYTKSHARKAAQLMTRDVVTVQADTPLSEVAQVLASRNIKRVPVMHNGRLVGILSRANIVQALATAARLGGEARIDDRQIREQILDELRRQPWAESAALYNIVVEDGVVHLWGQVRSEAERQATIAAAGGIRGVRKVEDHLVPAIHITV